MRLRGGFVRLWPGGSALLERQRASERAFDAVVAKPAGGGVVADVFARQGKFSRFGGRTCMRGGSGGHAAVAANRQLRVGWELNSAVGRDPDAAEPAGGHGALSAPAAP